MQSLTLICFGKLKTPGFEQAVNDFEKRLGKYFKFDVRELKPVKVSEKSDRVRQAVQETEAQMIFDEIEKVNRTKSVWAIDERGLARSTKSWAEEIEAHKNAGKHLVLVIGSGLGLPRQVLLQANKIISFGPQTFSHELARLVLTEQLYRAGSLAAGHPYHNEG